MMNEKRNIPYLPRVAVPLLLALLIALGTLLPGFVPKAEAAALPGLNIETGGVYRYSVSGKNPDSVKYGTATAAASKMTASLSGNTVTIRETESNKLYELGYVPIITSLNVPAETTLYVTLAFSLSGGKGGSGSAQETMELFDFGSSDGSSSLTFKTTSDSGSDTKASDRNTGNSMAANHTVTVAYRNTAAKAKNIYHYFGFFAGVHYGSSKAHQLEATCTIKSGTATTGNSAAAEIRFDHGDAGTTVVGPSGLKSATYPKTNFFPDVNYTALTEDQQKSIASISNKASTGDSSWLANRLSVKQPSQTELQIVSNAKPDPQLGRIAYTPFTVPITVPAYTKRTYCLTFEITYDRNSDSGAGFFAELIEGDVPDAFNTNNSAGMTGNTILRVYSDGGDAHSGTVEVRVELHNDTAAAKTYEQNYVFFAGHRSVGLYTPKPEFRLKLKNVGYNQYEDTYSVTKSERNCTIYVAQSVSGFTQLTARVDPGVGYSRPDTVTVKVDGETLAAAKYTYNKSTGQITIPMDYVRGAILISAQGTANRYTVTFDANGGTVDTKTKTVTYLGTYGALPTPTRLLYKFWGWTYSPDGGTGGVPLTDTSTVTKHEDHTLYALWERTHRMHRVCEDYYDTLYCTDPSHETIKTWTGWDGTDEIVYDADNTAYVAMASDVSRTAALVVDEGKTLYLCLNGNTLSGRIEVNGTLHLCNCAVRGEVTYSGGSVITVGKTGTLNYYDVLLRGGKGDNVPIYADGTVNLYGAPKIIASDTCNYEIRGNAPGFLHICANLGTRYKDPIRVNFGTDAGVSLTTYTQVTVTTGWSDYMSGISPTDHFVPRTGRNARIELIDGELVLRRLRVTLNDNGATYYPAYNGGKLSVTLPVRSRTGYMFDGWYTAETGGAKVTTTTVFSDDTTLYPRFTANTYTVNFHVNYTGGTNPASQSVTYDGTYGTLPAPTRAGYTFLGWYTAATGGTRVEGTTRVSRAASHTLYAHWEVAEIISIDITWGTMEFTYFDGDWNPETHRYENGGWAPTHADGDLIAIKNTGNVAVDVQFAYAQADTAVNARFSIGTEPLTAPVALPVGEEKTIRLTLTGKPGGGMAGATLGTVTVTIGGKQS